jgi:hypothetical protein
MFNEDWVSDKKIDFETEELTVWLEMVSDKKIGSGAESVTRTDCMEFL